MTVDDFIRERKWYCTRLRMDRNGNSSRDGTAQCNLPFHKRVRKKNSYRVEICIAIEYQLAKTGARNVSPLNFTGKASAVIGFNGRVKEQGGNRKEH